MFFRRDDGPEGRVGAEREGGTDHVEHDRPAAAECERLRGEMDSLQHKVQEQSREIQTQFIRIAEMQAVLDEERIAAGRPQVPRPLFPTSAAGKR